MDFPSANWIKKPIKTRPFIHGLTTVVVIVSLYLTNLYSYLLFHSMVEFLCIAIGLTLLLMVWNAREWLNDRYLFLLSTAFAFAAFVDLMHTMSFEGMHIFSSGGTNMSTQLWVAARLIQSISMAAAPFFLRSGPQGAQPEQDSQRQTGDIRFENALPIFYAGITIVVLGLIFSGLFPLCYIEGQGPTPFFIVTRYVISALLLASIGLLWMRRQSLSRSLLGLLIVATIATLLSSLSFTNSIEVNDPKSVLGLFAKLTAFILVFIAVVRQGIQHPYGLLVKNLNMRTGQLQKSDAYLRSILQTTIEGFCMVDRDGRITDVNEACCTMLGRTRAELFTLTIHQIGLLENPDRISEKLDEVVAAGSDVFLSQHRQPDGSILSMEVSITYLNTDGGKFICFIRDVSVREQYKNDLRERSVQILASEKRLKKAQAIAHVGDWTLNLRTQLIEWSDELFNIFKLDCALSEERLYAAITQAIHPEDRYLIDIDNLLAYAGKTPIIVRVIWPDLSIRHVQIETGEITRDADGQPVQLTGICQDITAQVLYEQALRESESMFANAFEYATIGKSLLSTNGKWLKLNQAYCDLLGYEQHELVGMSYEVITHPDDLEDDCKKMNALMAGEIQSYQKEKRYIQKSGSLVWVIISVSMVRKDDGSPLFLIGQAQDITLRKQATAELETQAQLMQTIYNTTPNMLFLKDCNSVYIEVNQAYCSFLGKSREMIIGRSDDDLFSAQDAAAHIASDHVALEAGSYKENEEIVNASGKHWLHVIKSAVKNSDQQCWGILCSMQDVTEYHRMLENITESNERYRASFHESKAIKMMVDPSNGKIVDANKSAVNFYGYPADELLQMTISQISAGPSEVIHGNTASTAAHNQNFSNSTHLLSSGELRDVEVYASPMTVKGQNLLFSIIHDVTQRKLADDVMQANARLHRSTENKDLQGIIETCLEIAEELTNSQVSYFHLVAANQELFEQQNWSLRTKQQFGETADLNRRYAVMDAKIWADCAREQRAVVHNNHSDVPSSSWLAADQAQLTREMVVPIFDDGQLVAIIGAANKPEDYRERDVAFLLEFANSCWDHIQIKRHALTIMQGEEQLRGVLSATPEIVFSVNEACQVQFINKSLDGRAIQDVIGSDALAHMDPSYQSYVRSKIETVFQTGEPGEFIVQSLGGLDEDVWYEGHLAPLFENGKVNSVIVSMMDITEKFEMQYAVLQTTDELMVAYNATLEGWSKALELRERETAGHSERVVALTLELARHLGVSETDIKHMQRGALLHDIGKIGVPDSILIKAGPLTDEEWKLMRQHPEFARRLLEPIDYLKPALDIPYGHHEKWDGSGYPQGLAGAQIPLAARIFSIVDVWDALLFKRSYRGGWTRSKVVDYIKDQSGTQFDPMVVEAFLNVVDEA